MISCTRRIQFCAGHRVLRHEGKCANPHGHNYVALFQAEADELDSVGRVIDFSVLKDKIGGWIDQHWDHGFIYFAEDRDMWESLENRNGAQWKTFRLPSNPTAENLAEHLLLVVCPDVLQGTGVRVTKVTLWETENCFAEVTLELPSR